MTVGGIGSLAVGFPRQTHGGDDCHVIGLGTWSEHKCAHIDRQAFSRATPKQSTAQYIQAVSTARHRTESSTRSRAVVVSRAGTCTARHR